MAEEVRVLLQDTLTADGAIQVALLNNRDLQALYGERDHDAQRAEREQREGVLRPGLLRAVGTAEPEKEAFDAGQRRRQLEDAEHVRAQRLREREDDDEEQRDLRPADRSHQNFSGLTSAYAR